VRVMGSVAPPGIHCTCEMTNENGRKGPEKKKEEVPQVRRGPSTVERGLCRGHPKVFHINGMPEKGTKNYNTD